MIKIENLVCGYSKQTHFQPLSVTIEKGSFTTIIGRNGSGKSTLLKTIAGLLLPQSGLVLVKGQPLGEMSNRQRAKLLACGMQHNILPQITVGELVLHGRYPHLPFPRKTTKQDIEIAEHAMEMLGIAFLQNKYVNRLSGGEAQKAFLAMLLAQQTEVLILDEPTTYLDLCHQQEFLQVLSKLQQQGITLVIAMHDIPAALEYSDKICLLHEHKLVYAGSPAVLLGTTHLKECFKMDFHRRVEEGRIYYSVQP